MRVLLAFLVWLFSFWTWKDFFLRWVRWRNPPSPSASGETAREEHVPSQEGQQESEFSRFLSSLPEGEGLVRSVRFDGGLKVTLDFGLAREFELFHGTDLHSGYCEFLEAVAASKVVFGESLWVPLQGEESCRHMEAFGDALRQSGNGVRNLSIRCWSGSAIRFVKCFSSVVLGNDDIQNLRLDFYDLHGIIGKVEFVEFMACIASPHIFRILKSFDVMTAELDELDGEEMERLIKPFKSPHSVLEVFRYGYVNSDVQLEHIGGMLATSTSLKTLDIRTFPVFRRARYTILAAALCSNQSLRTLICRIHNSEDLKALLDPFLPKINHVQSNTTITRLCLSGNIGGKEGIEILVDMLHTNLSLLKLRFSYLDDLFEFDPQGIENILAILEALKTNKSLKRIDFSYCTAIGGYKVLGAMMDMLLENHCIEDIDLRGTPMERSGDATYIHSALSKKNAMKLWDIVQGMTNVNPTSGRVFLCGQPYAGKTSLRISMMKQWQEIQDPKKVQNIPKWRKGIRSGLKVFKASKKPIQEVYLERTHGIEIDNVQCDGIGITIWDMAGQTDYHSFHELVMPNLSADGSCSMFLLMCNPTEPSNLYEPRKLQSVKEELECWLRFIASNTRRSNSYCPHVSIVMTHFDYWKDDFEFVARIEDVVQKLKSQFEEVLAFDEDKVVFKVDGTNVSHAHGVFDFIKSHLTNLLRRLPQTISACEEVQCRVAEWNADQSNPRMLKWNDFCKNMCKDVKDFNNVNDELSKRRMAFVAISLNDGGHIIYNEKASVVITNPHWFCHDIVGEFLYQCSKKNQKLEMVSPNGIISIDHMKRSILHLIGDQGSVREKFDDILDIMKKLNICFEQDTMSIMLPSFLNNHKILSWCRNDESSSFKYIGRRLACLDGRTTMLTPGFFTRLQVSFFKMLPSNNAQDTYEVFPEVIKFISDGIEVILQFNDGDIDILLRSYQCEDVVLVFLDIRIIGHIKALQEDPTLGCLGVRLIEHILRPECVERLLSLNDRKNQCVRVKDLELEFVRSGVNATHNWKSCKGLDVGFDKVSILLGSFAWKDLLKRRSDDLQDYHKEVKSLDMLSGDGPLYFEDEKGETSTPSICQRFQNLLYGSLDVKLDNIMRLQHECQEEVISKLDDVMRSIQKLEHGIENLQRDLLPKVCSRMDDLMAFSIEMQKAQIPKLAYLCEFGSQKLLTQFVPGLKRLKLHLMCESMHGFHEVANQEGCVVDFGTEDTRRFLGMLVCGLKIATILTKIGAHVACGMGSMVPDFSDGFNFAALILDTPGVLDYQISTTVWESLPAKERKISKNSLDDTSEAQEWLKMFLEPQCQNQREFYIKFKLNKVIYKRGRRPLAWICDTCKSKQCDELH